PWPSVIGPTAAGFLPSRSSAATPTSDGTSTMPSLRAPGTGLPSTASTGAPGLSRQTARTSSGAEEAAHCHGPGVSQVLEHSDVRSRAASGLLPPPPGVTGQPRAAAYQTAASSGVRGRFDTSREFRTVSVICSVLSFPGLVIAAPCIAVPCYRVNTIRGVTARRRERTSTGLRNVGLSA